MEWIEVTAKTVEEAKDAALDQLGVDEVDAEFEVLETPKAGLFGRLRSEARVRARVLPSTPPPKLDRRDRRRSSSRGEGGSRPSRPKNTSKSPRGTAPPPAPRKEKTMSNDVVSENPDEVASAFLSGLLDAFGVSGAIEQRQLEEDTTEIAVQGEGLGLLIGPKGQTLTAVQELTRTVVQRNAPPGQGRLVIDVGGYRQARRSALETFTRSIAEQVLASGVQRVLEPMPPADRKVVHDTVNTIDGVVTMSEGEEPNRRVVVAPEESG